MRVNIYAEELPEDARIELISKEIEGHTFTGLRIYLELPVTIGRHPPTQPVIAPPFDPNRPAPVDSWRSVEGPEIFASTSGVPAQVAGPFIHRPGDDDSAAITFWGKRDLRTVLRRAIEALDAHYAARDRS